MPIEKRESDSEGVPEYLSDETGESEAEFEYDGEIPGPEDLTIVDADEFYGDKK